MAQSFSLEEALSGASKPAAAPSKGFSLEDALGASPVKAKNLGLPAGEDLAALIAPAEDQPQAERKVYTGSVFDTLPFDPKFDPVEAERLSRRDYAEKERQQPRRTQSMRATPADQIDRTLGQAIADTGIGLLQGAAGIPKGIAANINAGDNPVAKFYEEAIQAGERSKSPYLQSQKAEREALLKNVLRNQGELAQTRAAFTSMFSPAGADIVAQGAGSMLPVTGMSLLGLGQKAFVATNALANAGEAAQNTARELAQMSPQDWSKSDAYQELRASGLSHADSVRMLAPLMAMPTQLLGGVVGGVSGATGLEKSLAGSAIKGGARERLARAGSELLGEEAETLAPSLAGNITQRLIDEQTSLTEGLGREAVETAFGATPGMALAAAGRSGTDAPKELDTRGLAERMARERGFLVSETRTEPPATTERRAPVLRPSPAPEKVEPTFDEESFVPAAPKAADNLTLQREQEQADVLALEAKAPERFANMDEAAKYDTPEMRLKQAEALDGNDVTGLIFGETESYGRAALKKKSLTAGYAEKMDNRSDAADAATVAFGTGDYSVFTPYEKLFPKTASKLKAALAPAPAPKPEVTPEPQVAAEETAQERLKRLSGKSIGMTNAFRDNIITNQEFNKFKADLEAARQAVSQEAPDLSALSPAKREILEIADKLEAAGVQGIPRGMRLNARPEAREPDEKSMEFYREKLKPYEEQQAAPEKKPYGLPEFFSDNEKEVARITGLMKSGPLKTRVALSEANDSIQRLADTIQAAGFDMNNLVKGQVPDGIMKIKSQIGNIAARSNRLAAAAEAVQKKYKRADPARVKADAAELMADVEEADNLIAEDQNLPPLAERMEGVAPPVSPEIDELLTKQRLANEDIRILSKRTAGTSLMKVLEGSLRDGEISELGGKARKIGKNPFVSLVAKKGKRGSSMEDMVESGALDLFLPLEMRPGQPGYANDESAEYIREKLRTGEFYTDDTRQEIDSIQRGIWEIEKEIEQELSLEDINREIQYAVDEQRELDQEAAPTPTEGATEAPESGAREEEFLKAQTKEELKAKQDEIDRLSKENERLSREAERKAKADEEAGDFVLTGSKRAADQAAARGQMELAEAEDVGADFKDTKSALTKLAEKLLDKGSERYEETELDGKLYQVRTRTFDGKLFGSELQLVKDTIGLARDVNLINEEDRVMTLQLTGKNVGEGRNVRIMDSQYTDQSDLDVATTEGITVVSDTKGKDDYGNAVSNIELSNGKKYQIIRLNHTESMGLPGWHDAKKFGPTDGGFLGNNKQEAIQRLIELNTPKEKGQTFFDISPAKAPSTDSAAFKRWFGDSKVVDENGEPRVMYHGTGFSFNQFTSYRGDLIYFAKTPKTAESYAKGVSDSQNEMGNYDDEFGRGSEDGGASIYPVYLSAQNIFDPDNEAHLAKLPKVAADELRSSGGDYGYVESNQSDIKAAGFDGVYVREMPDVSAANRDIAVFSPTQIKSATGNIGTYDPDNANILFDVRTSPVTGEPIKRAPSVTRRAKTLSRAHDKGKISDMEFVMGVNAAIDAAETAKMIKDRPARQRGADFIRQKLLEAKRRGDLSEEASDLAEWFILRNPALVDDLGISIRMKESGGTAGQYIPLSRIMVLMKGSANDTTPVHEILHHLERMMPADMQSSIRREWAKQMTQAKQKATTPNERKFFELLFQHHYHENGSKNDFDKAVELIQEGKVPYEFYQYVNPSEFWAVNGSDIMQGRFDAVRGGVLQRMKSWLKELGQKFKSIFGMPSSAPLLRALDSLAKADGVFITKDMLGESAAYAAITGKNVLGRKPLVNWTMPEATNLDSFIYSIQNKQIDMKRAIDAIKDQIGQIDERFDPYMKETLFAGRTATQTKRFLQNELEPLFKEMGRLDVNIPDFEEYLHNRHAQERNEQIATVNPGMPDKGSGIETADAQSYFANLPADQEAKYKKLASMVDAITSGTRQLLVDSGLESQDTIDTWESTYDNYIPLNRDDVDYSSNHGMGVGQGYSVRGPASRRAVGSERKVVDILANIAMQRERNIVRAEKNRVAMALYGMAIQNPNPEFFLAVNPDAKKDIPAATQELVDMGFLPSDIESLMNEPSTMEIDPQTGLAIERIHQMQRGADNVMGLRVNGENRYVFFNQNNDRAKRMATAIKNLDADQLGFILSTAAEITRFMAAMNTQYNPIFGAYNFLRDISTAGLQLTNTPLAGKQKEVLSPANVWGAMRGIYTDLRAERGGKAGTSNWSKLWEEFQQRGGQTGFRDQFSSTAKRGQALQRIVDPSSWADQGLGKVFTANGTLKVPMEAARKAAAPIFNWLSDYNETMENAIRLSAYKAAIDPKIGGMSKDAAAVLAKELTVNFNRKGQIATQAGALYAFFNASVQGTTALARTLSGPAGKKIVAGGLMLGAIQAALYSFAGFDEGEPPEFVREKNFVIPTMNGKYIAIPLPLGYNVIPNTARLITQDVIRAVQGKKIKPVDTSFKIFESLLGAFNPIGNAGWSMQTLAPTVLDPAVALKENRDWTGKKIAREDFNALDPTPGFTRYKESSTAFSRGLAEFMNSMSGGTKDAPGKISPTPDQIDYLIGQIFGGVGREAMKIERTARSLVTGEELPSYSIPIAGRFYGDTKGSSAVSNAFYENLKEMNIHENTVKGMRKRKENVQEYFRENPEARMFEEAGRVEREVQVLRKRRRALVEKEAPKESVKAIEERITAKMKLFNEKVKQREEKKS
jgi:hypothetical protein